jgi:hypothetical protein
MESVPLLAGPVFSATWNWTIPFPVPLVPSVIVSQDVAAVADQPQSAGLVTVTGAAVPPDAGAAWLVGSIVETHAPAWMTVNVWPAIVAVPARDVPAFAAAITVTAPLPIPAFVSPTVSHDALLVAVQAQPSVVCTATEVLPPSAFIGWVAG